MGKIITETPIDEFIIRFRHNAEHQRKIGDLHGCLEFRQLADTLEKYQQIQEIYERFKKDGGYLPRMAWLDVMEVVEDGKS